MTVYLLIVRERGVVGVDVYADRADALGMAAEVADSYPAAGRVPFLTGGVVLFHESLSGDGDWVRVEAAEVVEG